MLVRCKILKIVRGYYIGEYKRTGRKVKIVRNRVISNFKVGSDYDFYCRIEKGIFRDTLVPISQEEELERLE